MATCKYCKCNVRYPLVAGPREGEAYISHCPRHSDAHVAELEQQITELKKQVEHWHQRMSYVPNDRERLAWAERVVGASLAMLHGTEFSAEIARSKLEDALAAEPGRRT